MCQRLEPMKRKIRLLLVVVLIAVFLAVGLMQAFILYATSRSGGNQMASAINRLIPGTLKWDTLELHLFRGRFIVKDFHLMGADQEDIAGFNRLEVKWKWLTLLKGQMRFTSIRLKNPRVELGFDPEGNLNIIGAFASQTEKTQP